MHGIGGSQAQIALDAYVHAYTSKTCVPVQAVTCYACLVGQAVSSCFVLLLQPLAQALERSLGVPADQWHDLPWFQQVWFATENQAPGAAPVHSVDSINTGGAAHNYMMHVLGVELVNGSRTVRSKRKAAAHHLASYLVMLRNCTDHSLGVGLPRLQDKGENAMELIATSPALQPVADFVTRYAAVLSYPVQHPAEFEAAENAAIKVQANLRAKSRWYSQQRP
jgi:hypothetical protein